MAEEPSKPEPLPRMEWDFLDVENSELESVFFEEYSLHSKAILAWIEWVVHPDHGLRWLMSLRSTLGKQNQIVNGPEWLSPEVEEFKTLPFQNQISLLAYFSNRLPEAGIFRGRDGRQDLCDAFKNEEKLILEKFAKDEFIKVELGESGGTIHGVLGNDRSTALGSITANCQNFVLSIPDYMSRESILRVFAEELDKHWPEELSSVYKRSSAFNVKGKVELPFSKRTALGWLGVLRRVEACGGSWGNYLKMYPESGDIDSVKRKLREQCKKAREIIKWFDACGRGQIVSKNNSRTIKWAEGKGN